MSPADDADDRSASGQPRTLDIGRAFRELRNQVGFSQKRVAEISGLTVSTISAFENSRRGHHPGTLAALLVAIDRKSDDLYSLAHDPSLGRLNAREEFSSSDGSALPSDNRQQAYNALLPVYAELHDRIAQGRHEEALHDIFIRRIRRGNEHFSFETVGALQEDLEALVALLPRNEWSLLDTLSPHDYGYLLYERELVERALGKVALSRETLRQAVIHFRKQRNLTWLSICLADDAKFERHSSLERALAIQTTAVEVAAQASHKLQLGARHAECAQLLQAMDRQSEARFHFERMLASFADLPPPALLSEFRSTYHAAMLKFCQFLCDTGEASRAHDIADSLLRTPGQSGRLGPQGWHQLTLGRAHKLNRRFEESERAFALAASRLDTWGRLDHTIQSHLLRARFYLSQGLWLRALDDLDIAQRQCEEAGCRLWLADVLLCQSVALRANNETNAAAHKRDLAVDLAKTIGYARCLREAATSKLAE